jgi:hypothetical protein
MDAPLPHLAHGLLTMTMTLLPPHTVAPPRALPLRQGLYALGALNLAIGLYGVISPHGFYENVLGVDLLGPYNQHFMSDIGGFYLGFAIAFLLAARSLSPDLIRGICAGYAVTQLLHFLYHITHLGRFSAGEAIAQTIGLAIILAAPVICTMLTARLDAAAEHA